MNEFKEVLGGKEHVPILTFTYSYIPVTSLALIPRFSPRIITLVPGGPSAGEMPVTTGGGLILSITLAWDKRRNYNSDFHLPV